MSAVPAQRCFSVDEYERMIVQGILCDGERVELIGGIIVQMAAMGPPHRACITTLNEWFVKRVPPTAVVQVQAPSRLPPRWEPEPDIAIIRRRPDNYRTRHPGAGDIFLLIEVSATSLGYDRDIKLPGYAEAEIPEAWIWDLDHELVLVCRSPRDGAYQEIEVVERVGTLTPLAFPELQLSVDEILGPRL